MKALDQKIGPSSSRRTCPSTQMITEDLDAPSPVGRSLGPKRRFKVTRQSLALEVDFASQSLSCEAELTILPEASLNTLELNCRQITLTSIFIDDILLSPDKFNYRNYLRNFSPMDKRDMQTFYATWKAALDASDEGELRITLPSPTKLTNGSWEPLRVKIIYNLDQPQGGLVFTRHGLLTQGQPLGSRMWMPCLDSLTDLSLWKLSITVSYT